MTDEEIDALEGIELCVAVARNVMRWSLSDWGYRQVWVDHQGRFKRYDKEWRPDCNIVDAWMVVEHLCENEYHMEISIRLDAIECAIWRESRELGEPAIDVAADVGFDMEAYKRVPEAICKAALKARREEAPDD